MNLHELELRYLRYFVPLAEELNFRRTAERLHITPSALSAIIQKLEGILEMKLFERTTTKVQLTAEGRMFLPKARAMLDYVEEALNDVWKTTRENRETLHIAVCGSWKTTVVPETLDIYRKRFPNVAVSLIDAGLAGDGSKALEKRRVDIRFSYGLQGLPEKNAGYFVMFDLPLQAFMSAEHPLAARKQVTLAELAAHPVQLFHPFTHLNQNLLALFRDKGLKPRVRKSTSFDICKAMVITGECVALVAKHPGSFHNDPQVVHRPLKGLKPVPRMKAYALWKEDGATPQTLRFIEILRQVSTKRAKCIIPSIL